MKATFLVILLVMAGCGRGDRPELGHVTGRVTLDGEPLAGAKVTFRHPEKRASHATTDEDGRYELVYIRETKGAAVGTHRVEISTATAKTLERVPAKYHRNTTLVVEVEPGKNTLDFDLKSR